MIKAKSIFKRSLAILLTLLTIMSVGLTNIIALTVDMVETGAIQELAETGADSVTTGSTPAYTVYFKNTENWNTVNCYLWTNGGEMIWPGYAMTNLGNGYYSYTSTTQYTKCIFNNGSTQTDDLTTNWGNVYDYKNGWQTGTFTSGTTLYFDYTGCDWWTSAGGTEMYVAFTSDTNKDSAGHIVENRAMTKIGDSLFMYTITDEDPSTCMIRFWRGTSSALWDYSRAFCVLEGDYNGIKLTDNSVYNDNGTPYKYSNFSLTEPTFSITPTPAIANNEVTLADTTSSYTLTYKYGSTTNTTPANTELFTYEYSENSNVIGEKATSTWVPTSTGDYTIKYKVSLSDVASSETTNTVTVNPNSCTVTFNYDNGNESTTATIAYNTAIGTANVPAEPAKAATDEYTYTFAGWLVGDFTTPITSAALAETVITGDTTVTASYTAVKNTYAFAVNSNDATMGSVTVAPADLASPVEYGTSVTLTATAVDGYRFIGFTGTNGTETVDYSDTNVYPFTVKGAVNITANFVKIEYKTVTVNSDSTMGTVKVTNIAGADVDLSAVKYGTMLDITATNNTGYVLEKLTVNGTDYTSAATATITVTDNVTVEATWKVKTSYDFTLRAPSSLGSAEGTVDGTKIVDTNSSDATYKNVAEVDTGTTITLTANVKDTTNTAFNGWTIDGSYTPVSGTLSDATITITVNGEVTATASFKKTTARVYAHKTPTGYGDVYLKYDGQSLTKMNYNSTGGYYYWDVPVDVTWIDFADSNGNNMAQLYYADGVINHGDTMDISTGKGNNNANPGWSFGSFGSSSTTTGYYISYGSNKVKLEDYGDGLYVGSVTYTGTEISVNPLGGDGNYWNLNGTVGDGTAPVVKGGTTAGTAVTIELGEENEYGIDFVFDPANNTLSWTSTGKPDTVTIYGYDGISGANGTTTFVDNDAVWSQDSSNDPRTAEVVKGAYVTVQTTLTSSDYRVEGWVVNGTDFIKAEETEDATVFIGKYNAFEDGDKLVPVYFHSATWLSTNKVETITVYAQFDSKIKSENWNQYMAAYTWYSGDYRPFGEWPGQIMIPSGEPGVFYTYIEKAYGTETVAGITVNNYVGGNGGPSGTNYQSYDYYEFIKLQDKKQIIFVIKPSDDGANVYNNGGAYNTLTVPTDKTSANDLSGYNEFVVFSDDSYQPLDINRDVIENLTLEEAATKAPAFYIIRTGLYVSEDPNGYYYVRSHVYDEDKKYIGTYMSYELIDATALCSDLEVENLDDYAGRTVHVSYESYTHEKGGGGLNNPRYDGEWYGIEAEQTINVHVRVALEGSTELLDPATDTVDFGTASINGNGTTTTILYGGTITLAANTSGAYKFDGWYYTTKNDDGTYTIGEKFSTNINEKLEKVTTNDSMYVAMFAPLAEGQIIVFNNPYAGNANNTEMPPAHSNGDGALSERYVQIQRYESDGTTLVEDTGKVLDSAEVTALEGQKLKITIYTKPTDSIDWVYAWYTNSIDGDGDLNYEEVGMTEEFTEAGMGQEKSFSFWYEVKSADSTSRAVASEAIGIYSDIVHKSMNVNLVYQYLNRGDAETKYYTVNYTLQGDERAAGKPSPETIEKYAPYVDDIYKDVKWTIANVGGAGTTFTLVADYDNQFTVDIYVNGKPATSVTGAFNDNISLYATTYDDSVTNNGFWYVENGSDMGYTDGTDTILGYGTFLGQNITDNMIVNYQSLSDGQTLLDYLGYQVILGEPVYGREQSTVNGVNNDKIYIDYIVSLHLPYFNGDAVPGNDEEVLYDSLNSNSPVTLDTLTTAAGYTADYGVILEMINTANDPKLGYLGDGVLRDEMVSKIESGATSGLYGNNTFYCQVYSAISMNCNLTNKNRVLMTFASENTTANQNKFFNVYGYLKLTDAEDNSTYYFSNQQTMDIKTFIENYTSDKIINK